MLSGGSDRSGKLESSLWRLSSSNANQLAEIKLPAMPVFDGMSIRMK